MFPDSYGVGCAGAGFLETSVFSVTCQSGTTREREERELLALIRVIHVDGLSPIRISAD